MRYSGQGLNLTEKEEGLRLVAYQDVGGIWTIGYGHTGKDVREGMTCTQEQAEHWLLQDVQQAENDVNDLVQVELTQEEFDALVDFQFNTGALGKSHLLIYVNQGQFELAAREFEKWDHVHGVVIAGLLRRRLEEEQMFKGTAS
jgi:lysozyme